MRIILNGAERILNELPADPMLADLVRSLGFRQDRVALEQNGEIVPRTQWTQTSLTDGDRIELVHFVGGGTPERGGPNA